MSEVRLDTTFSPEEEKQVLVNLYYAAGGHRWCNNTGWLDADVHHCMWYGITCHTDAPYVKTIQLAFNNLNGSLPKNLWKLRNLLALCPNDNPLLGGRVEDIIHSNMSELVTLSIRQTSYSGQIPDAITKLVRLRTLLASGMLGEKLYGPLPSDIGNMTELRVLGIEENKFNGSIPRSITRLSKLYYFGLQNAEGLLSGHLNDLLSLKSMASLYVSGLTLYGTFPEALPCHLRTLFMPGNKLRGTLPWKFQCGDGSEILTEVNLSNNMLTGAIPRIFFSSKRLTSLDLSRNAFQSLHNDTDLMLNDNKLPLALIVLAGNRNLSFDLARFLAYTMNYFPNLRSLNLNSCGIRGQLKNTLWYQYRLLTLDLGNNRLHGDIPAADLLSDLPMTYLDLSNNRLTGPVPLSLDSATLLQHFNITGNPAMSDGESRGGKVMNPTFLKLDFQNMYRSRPSDNFTCPEIRLSINGGRVYMDPSYYGYRFCVCDGGYYGADGNCGKCLSGATCRKPKVAGWTDLNKSTVIMDTGFWPMPEPGNVTRLRQCSSREVCNPSGTCSCWLQASTNSTKCNTTCLCSSGSTGRFCSKCLGGFYKRGQTCSQCEGGRLKFYISLLSLTMGAPILYWTITYKGSNPLAAYAALVTQELLIVTLVLLGFLRGWVLGAHLFVLIYVVVSRRDDLQALIKIATFYLQVLDSMISTVDIFPDDIIATQHYFTALWNLHFTDISCDFAIFFTPVGKFLSLLLLPVTCIVLVWVYYGARRLVWRWFRRWLTVDETVKRLNFKCRRITIIIVNFAYFPVVAATIASLTRCEKDSGVSFLPSMPWVDCPSSTHTKLVFMGWASLVLYVVGVPCFVFLPALIKNRGIIKDGGSVEHEELEKWLGPLYSTYCESCKWFYEIVLLTRRLALAFILSFLKIYPSWQTLLVCCVLTVSLVVHLLVKPFKSRSRRFPIENTLETFLLSVLLNSFAAIRFVEDDSIALVPITSLIIGANALVIVGFVFSAVFLACCSPKSHQGYESL